MSNPVERINPPVTFDEIQKGRWSQLPTDDPVVTYWLSEFWDRPITSDLCWEVARLSSAVYVYREISSGWVMAVKFYSVKTGDKAQKYAVHELELTQQAQELFDRSDSWRVINPLAYWSGVLFFEFVQGLTLEDVIAVRHSQPGQLFPCLELTASFLAELHVQGTSQLVLPDFAHWESFARKIVTELYEHGVVKDEPVIRDGLDTLIEKWAQLVLMEDYVPAFSHGDATTSNFVFPPVGGMVAIDWERAGYADPAADFGRLIAEVSHSMNQHGGSVAEAQLVLQHLIDAYCQALPPSWDTDGLLARARFYQAISTLRIARNGWVSRLDRTLLVAQALALLSKLPD